MAVAPLTHHDVVKFAAPMSKAGFKVNLSKCDRAERYIEFEPQAGELANTTVIHGLQVDEDARQLLSRVAVHKSGLASSITAVVTELNQAIETFEKIPLSRQFCIEENYIIAYSFTLKPEHSREEDSAILQSNFICAQAAGIELRIDTSTGGGMPADVRLLAVGIASPYLPETLADGTDLPIDHRAARPLRLKTQATPNKNTLKALPDDLLAVLGTQWRPLRFQGDHWKGVLRQLGTKQKRTAMAEKHTYQAVQHLSSTLSGSPEQYHIQQTKARWQVYLRRLQPLMVFIGILALMPISWLFVSSGTMSIHPLALGLTPLLMVGVVVLTAREIPVMEIPPTPRDLPSAAWSPYSVNNDQTAVEIAAAKVPAVKRQTS